MPERAKWVTEWVWEQRQNRVDPGVCFPSAGEFSGSKSRKCELMWRCPLLLYRSQLLCWPPLLLGVKQRCQLPVLVPLPGLSYLKLWKHKKQNSLMSERTTVFYSVRCYTNSSWYIVTMQVKLCSETKVWWFLSQSNPFFLLPLMGTNCRKVFQDGTWHKKKNFNIWENSPLLCLVEFRSGNKHQCGVA